MLQTVQPYFPLQKLNKKGIGFFKGRTFERQAYAPKISVSKVKGKDDIL